MKMESYDPRVLDSFVKRLVDFTKENSVIVKGPIPLPTRIEKYTVIRSPHIDKNSREQFEIRRHKRLLDIIDPQPRLLDEMNSKISIPSSIDMKIQVLTKEGDE